MKVTVNSIIFAIALGFVLLATESNAKESNKTNASPKVTSLVKAQQKAFEQYINEQYTPFVEQEDWKVFVEIVTYYNNSPSKFLNVDAEKQKQFRNAVSLMIHSLSSSNDTNAKDWLQSLKKTSHNINFLWKLDWNGLMESEELENQGEQISSLNGF